MLRSFSVPRRVNMSISGSRRLVYFRRLRAPRQLLVENVLLHQFIDPILQAIRDGVEAWSYLGVVLMMAIESANVPLPSEAIMPTAGLLVQQGKMSIHLAALAGAIGCLVGSIPSYFLGLYGGRPFLQKYGKLLLLREKDLDTADKWVAKYGDWAFLVCR